LKAVVINERTMERTQTAKAAAITLQKRILLEERLKIIIVQCFIGSQATTTTSTTTQLTSAERERKTFNRIVGISLLISRFSLLNSLIPLRGLFHA